MKLKVLYIICVLCMVFLNIGCTRYYISISSSDSLQQKYYDGVRILTSDKSSSFVHFEIAQDFVGGSHNVPLAVFVLAQIKKGEDFLFDIDSLSAFQDNKEIEILSYESAKKSTLNFGKVIESFGIFTPKQKSESTNTPMLIYRGYPGFFIYTPWVYSARERIAQGERLDESRREKSVILSSYLRKNTLKVGEPPRGGFIAIDPSILHSGVLELRVKIANETHQLLIMLQNKGESYE